MKDSLEVVAPEALLSQIVDLDQLIDLGELARFTQEHSGPHQNELCSPLLQSPKGH